MLLRSGPMFFKKPNRAALEPDDSPLAEPAAPPSLPDPPLAPGEKVAIGWPNEPC